MAVNNKIQVIYRLENLIVLSWPVRPNAGSSIDPESYNVYWCDTVGGTYVQFDSVENRSHASRSFLNKVVLNVIPEKIGWDNTAANFIRLRPVVGGVEQAFEDPVAIAPYSVGGMRFNKTTVEKSIAVGYNEDEDRLVPMAVDNEGKLKTI